jgi:hypothetical protein
MSERMARIKFSEDWDKLADPRFTTIRSYRLSKETYYRSQIGRTLTVWRQTGRSVWNGHKVGQATLLRVSKVKPRDLPVDLLIRDVTRKGKPDAEWLARLVDMPEGLLLEFENHTGLLGLKGSRTEGAP